MREHWTLDRAVVHLNHGSFGAVPRVTQEAQRRLHAEAEANPMRWFRDLPARLVRTREAVGRYLGVRGDEVGLVTNATTGVNVALRSIALRPGGTLVLTRFAYGAVLLAARQVAAERGCRVEVVDLPLDATDQQVVDALEAAADDSTACFVVDQVTSSTAKVLPVEAVGALGRRLGVPVVVDGAHAPGLVDQPVAGDFWSGNLHKWSCAPRGTAVLYVADEHRAGVLPPVVSWSFAEGFPSFLDFPGTTDATGWLAAPVSLDLLESLDFAGQRRRLGELVAEGARLVADALGSTVVDVGTPAPTMRLVGLPDGLVYDDAEGNRLAAYTAEQTGVETAVTSWSGRGFLRLSAHLYNRLDDFAVAAARLRPLFADPSRLRRIATSA